MITRTLYFGDPAYLSLRDRQLEVHLRQGSPSKVPLRTIPIADIGVVLLDDPQIIITHDALNALLEQNRALSALMGVPRVEDRATEEGMAAILWGSCDWVQAGAFPSVFVSLL